MEFFECSAKTADGVNKAFISIAKKLIEKKYENCFVFNISERKTNLKEATQAADLDLVIL